MLQVLTLILWQVCIYGGPSLPKLYFQIYFHSCIFLFTHLFFNFGRDGPQYTDTRQCKVERRKVRIHLQSSCTETSVCRFPPRNYLEAGFSISCSVYVWFSSKQKRWMDLPSPQCVFILSLNFFFFYSWMTKQMSIPCWQTQLNLFITMMALLYLTN